jgi:hypothetical protein
VHLLVFSLTGGFELLPFLLGAPLPLLELPHLVFQLLLCLTLRLVDFALGLHALLHRLFLSSLLLCLDVLHSFNLSPLKLLLALVNQPLLLSKNALGHLLVLLVLLCAFHLFQLSLFLSLDLLQSNFVCVLLLLFEHLLLTSFYLSLFFVLLLLLSLFFLPLPLFVFLLLFRILLQSLFFFFFLKLQLLLIHLTDLFLL